MELYESLVYGGKPGKFVKITAPMGISRSRISEIMNSIGPKTEYQPLE